MIDNNESKKLSKFLSLVLRHKPETIEIKLDKNGWVSVEELFSKMNANKEQITMPLLEYIVANNNKKRFCFNSEKTMIRATQGHSLNVDLDLIEKEPPEIFFHGTIKKNLQSIFDKGLLKMNRNYVHLSADVETAVSVGKRRGAPIVLKIDAEKMVELGFKFYISKNGVWLTDTVPADFCSQILLD